MDIARSSFKVFAAEILGVLLSFGSITYFARELGSATIGVFFLFQGLLFFLGKPADLGMRFAAEKRISEGEMAESVLTTALLVKSALLVFTLVGLHLGRNYVNQYLGSELVLFLGLALILQEVSGLMKNSISGELRVGKNAYINFTYHLIKYGGGAVLVFAGFGVMGLIVSLIVGLFVRFLLAFHERETGFGHPRLDQLHSIVDYAKFTIIPSVGSQVYKWMDILLLGYILSHASVGAYEIAWRVCAPVLLLSQSISVVVFPQMSAWDSAGSRDAIERLFSRIVTPSLILVFPAFFGSVVLSKEILTLVFGAEYRVAWAALIVIMAGKLPGGLRTLTGRSLYALDQPKLVTIASVVEIVANVVLNVVLILEFGILGAALGTTISVTVGTIARTYFLSQHLEISVPYAELGWCSLASAAMAALLYEAKQLVEIDTFVQLMGFIVAGAAIYTVAVLLYSPFRNQITTQLENYLSWPL